MVELWLHQLWELANGRLYWRLLYCCRHTPCAIPCEAKKLCDVERRGNPNLEEEWSRGPALEVSVPRRQRRAMRHVRDGVRFDQFIAGVIEPHITGIVVDRYVLRRRVR